MKDVYTLADLQQGNLNQDENRPIRLAVIGNPIAHSKSPAMQQAALDKEGISAQYIRIQATEDEFDTLIKTLVDLKFIGVNVTVPYKQNARKLCAQVDDLGKATGAVNTLVFHETGEIHGFNTDGPGFVKAIREEFSMDIKDLKIAIIGATGGAGLAVSYACAMNSCESLTLIGRSENNLEQLSSNLSNYFIDENRLSGASDRLKYAILDTIPAQEAIHQADLIINATSLGLKPTDPSPISPALFEAYHLVYDLQTHADTYQREAAMRGARVANGLSMLVYQGALAFEKWFGIQPNVSVMKQALLKKSV